jgi:hypothetical protein
MLLSFSLVGTLMSLQVKAPLQPGYSRDGITYLGSQLKDSNDGTYSHRVRTNDADKAREYTWEDHASAFHEFRRFDDRVALLGTVGTSGDGISIVDLKQPEPSAFVLCREPKFSPSGRRITYLNFVPRHASDEGSSDILMFVDLAATGVPALGNIRGGDGWVVESANRGNIIYPESARGKRVFPSATGPRPELILDGAWPDDRRFIALVFSSGSLKLIEAGFNAASAVANRELRTFKNADFALSKALSVEDLHALQFSLDVKDAKSAVIRWSELGRSKEILVPIQ